VKSVDLLPIITEQINPQHQFTATIQIPSHGLQVDVQLNNQKKKKNRFGASGRAFQQGSNKRFQWARQPDRWGVGGWWAAGTTRVGGHPDRRGSVGAPGSMGSVGGGQLDRRVLVGGGHPDRRGSVGAPGSIGSMGGGQLDRRVSVGGGQLDRRGSMGGVHLDRDGFSQPILQAEMASVAGWTWVGAGLIRPAGRGQWERPATLLGAGQPGRWFFVRAAAVCDFRRWVSCLTMVSF
jgi:hypothetical protein